MVQIFESLLLNKTCAKNSFYSRRYHKFHQKFPAANVPSISIKERQVKKNSYYRSVYDTAEYRTLNKLDETGRF
jgi:hypothetical protein